MPTRAKHNINPQTRYHDHDTITRQRQRGTAQEPAAPIPFLQPLARRAALDTSVELTLVVLVLDQALVVGRFRV